MLTRIPRWVFAGSGLLAFSAGYVNVVALLGFANNAVSHVTGTVTVVGDALANRQWESMLPAALIVACFFAGAVLSGVIVRSESLKMGRRYGVALGLEAIFLFAAALLFQRQNFYGELLATMACGLQNAMVATYSGSVIRTTHLTGIVSDIGAAIGSRLSGVRINRLQVLLQTLIFASFMVGATMGSIGFGSVGYRALLLPAGIVLVAGFVYTLLSPGHS